MRNVQKLGNTQKPKKSLLILGRNRSARFWSVEAYKRELFEDATANNEFGEELIGFKLSKKAITKEVGRIACESPSISSKLIEETGHD
jgi:hypothetical protein